MKIIFIATKMNLVSGGGSNFTLDLKLKFLQSAGHDVSLVTLFSKGNKFVSNPPYKIISQDFSGKSFVKLQKAVYSLIFDLEKDVDVFHFDDPSLIWVAGRYKKTGGKAKTVVFLNNYLATMFITKPNSKLNNFILNKIKETVYLLKRLAWEKVFGLSYSKHIDLIYADSPVVKKIYQRFGVNGKVFKVLPEFIDLSVFKEYSDHQNSQDTFKILFVGRLIREKGVDLLLESFLRLAKELNISLDIIGDGPEFESISGFVTKNSLVDKVKLIKWLKQDQVVEYYRSADIFVHPCRWPEPFGRTIVEAMISGTPVITSTDTGAEWIVGESGLIFKKGNIADLTDKIKFLYKSREVLSDLRKKAINRAKEFDYTLFTDGFEKDLNSLAKEY